MGKRSKELKVFLFENLATKQEIEIEEFDLKKARAKLTDGDWLLIRSATKRDAGKGLSLNLHRKKHTPM